ncbi:fad-binding domain-containing protein [Apiospora arundinis]
MGTGTESPESYAEPTPASEKPDSIRESADASTPPSARPSSHPTHHIDGMKTGVHGVQLLVSTKDHLYNAKQVEGGDHSWQCVGSWEDQTIQKVTALLSQRTPAPSPAATNGETAGFRDAYGSGYMLGGQKDNKSGHKPR